MKNGVHLVQCDFCPKSVVNIYHTHVIIDGKEFTMCPNHVEENWVEITKKDESEDNDG